MKTKISLLLLLFVLNTLPATAWLYPEHRRITLEAIRKLDPKRRMLLEQMWAAARVGHEHRLCANVIEPSQGLKPSCLDYAAWSAIGGDHSISAADMTQIVLYSDWILNVANIAAKLQVGLANARNRSERISDVRDSDIKLLRADPDYVTRAGKNNGHFMLALPHVNMQPEKYFALCFSEGTELNTVGTYTWYHTNALIKASQLRSPDLTPEQRSALALAALADEGFAQHFLEDSFTSGHVAGLWGDAANRKGTHDFYNEEGLRVDTWNGNQMVLMGDATLRDLDIGWTSDAVLLSLEQLIDAASGAILQDLVPANSGLAAPDTFNVSQALVMPNLPLEPWAKTLCDSVLINIPVPGLVAGLGEMPRFRSEMGPFIGLSAATSLNYLNRGFFSYQNYNGFNSGLELGIRFGLGMEGVLNESSDGLVFLDLGARIDLGSTQRFDYDDEPEMQQLGDYVAAIPTRDAYYIRLRLPFFLIPGDLIILAPVLAIASPNAMQKVITTASNGGFIPWQTGLPTPIGRFQFVLGREACISFYGSGRGPDPYIVTIREGDALGSALDEQGYFSMYTTRLEFPVVEYRPFRTYSTRQTGSLKFQLLAGFDIPGERTTIFVPDDYTGGLPETQTVWFAGIRLVFDYRYYFGGKGKR